MDEHNPPSTPPFSLQLQRDVPDDSELHSSDTNNSEYVFITHIRATDVVSGLHRVPVGFYAMIEVDGKTTKTLNKPVLVGKDVVEWDEEILLPPERSSSISFKVYVSFELEPRFGNGELLREFKITVEDVPDLNPKFQLIRFLVQRDDVLPSCSSVRIVAERRICDINESTTKLDLPESDAMSQLELLTDNGHRALLRYQQLQNQADLDEAITYFERIQDVCPADHPNHSAALFNLATSKFIDCQDNNRYLDLNVPITLYRDALDLCTSNHPDHCVTALDLCFALLARLQRLGNKTDRMGATDLLSGVKSFAYRVAWLALQMAGISVSMKSMKSRVSQVDNGDPDDERLIRMARAMLLDLPDGNPCRPAVLTDLGSQLYRRFEDNGNLVDIHDAILMLEYAVQLTPDGYPEKPALLNKFGISLSRRFEHLGDLADMDKCISMLEEALRLTPNGHPDKPGWLHNLGSSLCRRFERLGDLVDIDKSISICEDAACLTPNGHPDKPARLSDLGTSLSRRFERLGDLTDMDNSILMKEAAVRLTPSGHPNKPGWLNNLGNSLLSRFQRLGDLTDMEKSISMLEEALRLTPNGHPDKPCWLSNLRSSLSRRFERLGDLVDIDKSISMFEDAARLTPNGHPNKPIRLCGLGSSLSRRFDRLGDLADMDNSILTKEKAVRLTPDDHPEKPARLSNLGNSFLSRFQRLGDLTDMDKSISMCEDAVRLTPNDHPNQPTLLCNLGSSLSRRFQRLGDLADIDKSISVFEEAIRITPNGHPDKPGRLSDIGISLSRRFQHLGNLMDMDKSISMFEDAVRLTPHGHPDKPAWLNNLGKSLFRRFERLGDLADIEKSISLTKQAVRLTPNGHPDKPAWLQNLGSSLVRRFERLNDVADIDNSISTFEEALCLAPNDHPGKSDGLNNLGSSLFRRFEHLGDLVDIDKSILMCEDAVRLTPSGHPYKPARLSNLGNSLFCRFERLGDLADINKSISMFEEAICLTPNCHPSKPAWLSNHGSSLFRRFECLGDLTDIDKSILMLEDAVGLTPDGHPDKPGRLANLGGSLSRRFWHLSDLADINRSILMSEEAVCLTPNGHPDKPARLNNIGVSLSSRFERLAILADIEKSISMFEEAVCLTPHGHPDKAGRLDNLGNAFMKCFEHSRDPSHLSAATLHFSLASNAFTGPPSIRFRSARRWISSARIQDNSQTLLDAYATTINLLPQLAWLGFPLTERHRVLVQAADVARDAAATAVEAGCPEMAVEWLEQGRSIVWSRFLQLRTPVDELRVEHPDLADQFQQISQQLEYASSRDHAISRGSANDLDDNTRSLEEEVQRHHNLALRREKLLADIRSLPDFDRFLLPKTIKKLAALAYSGPVIYLNASKERCDALIVMSELGSVTPVPLPGISYRKMELLQSVLRLLLKCTHLIICHDDIFALIPSEENLDSQQLLNLLFVEDGIEGIDRAVKVKPQQIAGYAPDDLFRKILTYLWNDVVKPIVDALGFSTPPSRVEKKTRIFWCPTGPFTFLPIHAAGLYGTAEAGTKLSDFAISSYIPTLSALASSPRKDSNGCLSNLHLVAVQDSDGTIEDVMENMKNADWVHFACHGMQDPDNPLDSGLCLADHRRLKHSDIIQLARPQGGLAFLSACQTAQGDVNLPEESVHLAAGMLLAGYGGVISTMWSIMDRDAPTVTQKVYEHLFRDSKVPDSTEAAAALHYAVQHLRDSGASFSSWVPFIHVGR